MGAGVIGSQQDRLPIRRFRLSQVAERLGAVAEVGERLRERGPEPGGGSEAFDRGPEILLLLEGPT